MRRAKRILLVASMLLLVVSSLEASLFRRKPKPAAETVPAASAMSLTAIETDGPRVILRTSGAPAYTSYNPLPDVYIVDLTATTRPADLAIPSMLPPGIASVSAEEATEMGTRLTRVTFRLSQPVTLQVMAAEKSVVVASPASAVTEAAAPVEIPAVAAVETVPAPVPAAEIVEERPIAEPVTQLASEPIAGPAAISTASLPKAKRVKKVETSGTGDALELRIAGDGAMTYKAFRLEAPSRLVIDLAGVTNAAPKNNIAVDDPVVKRVRVAQFKGAPDPVTRVVVDLGGRTEYTIATEGDVVRVAFGGALSTVTARKPEPVAAPIAASSEIDVAPARNEPVVEAPKPAVKTVSTKSAPADVAAQVPTIAENATWRMPPSASKGARPVITSAGDQTPPSRPNEDVFGDQQPTTTPSTPIGQVLSGGPNAPGGVRTLSSTGDRTYTGEPLSLNLKDADIKDVLRTFAQLTGLNVAVDPNVTGRVTVDFADVPWDQALDIILRQNSLTHVLEGNVMRIGTLERIAAETSANRRLDEEARLNVPLTTVIFKLSYARATEVQGLLKEIASPRARIIVDARTNQLIISEISQYLTTMRNLIETIDIPNRQVAIEARIVETSKLFQQTYGFNWGFRGALDPAIGTGTGLVFPNRVGFTGGPFSFTGGVGPVLGITLTDVLGAFSLDFALHAFEVEGLVRVISAPRVLTQDNVAAEIQSGLQIPYQTRVNFTTTVTYIDATLRLQVTPQITEAGTVIMDISVQKIEPFTAFAIEGAAGTSLSTRQAKTRLMVRDGATSVIGGIYQTRDNSSQNRVPFVHSLPIIGALFRSNSISTQHDELLIFITPRIVRG
jgi:type IV pilus assembly protein PilQ